MPDIEDGDPAAAASLRLQQLQGKVRHTSLKSRPGALRRKEKLLKGEMDRFSKSLAQLQMIRSSEEQPGRVAGEEAPQGAIQVDQDAERNAGAPGPLSAPDPQKPQPTTAAQGPSTANRWAALRGFIAATMEQNPAFLSTG